MRWRTRRSVPAIFAITLGLAMQLGSAGVAGAHVARSAGGGRVVPVQQADGKSASALLGQVWSLVYTTPVTQPPSCLRIGRTGHVLAVLTSDQSCTIERGTPLFISHGGTCDDVVDSSVDPNRDDYAVGEAAQRECAKTLSKEVFAGVSVAVDDGTAVDVRKPRYEVVAPQQHVQLPPDNFYEISPRSVTFVAFGWSALVQNLSLGVHTLHVTLDFTDGESVVGSQTIIVTPHHHG